MIRQGNVLKMQHNTADRRLLVTVDEGTFKGTATLQSPIGTNKCVIQDRDTRNNTSICQ
ncbi:MAG TPA: hypothetical protein VLR90_12190 [Blastocatellia bacterium]|nr:hypothetical protein [Blastocatellia bacterium]